MADSNAHENWHHLSPDEALARLSVSSSGLSCQEAAERLERHGPNRLPPPKKRTLIERFLVQFHNLLIYVLLLAAVVTMVLAHYVDAGVILAVVVINAIIGVMQEGKAERAMDAIRNMLSNQAMVRRDGDWVSLPAQDLVPGDVVALQAGDKAPADLRLLTAKDLRLDEAILTGESLPVDKATSAVAAEALLGDRKCLAYSGTMVTYGQGTGVVVATGPATEIGRISSLLGKVQTLTTPLLRQTETFAKWLTITIVALAGVTFAFGVTVHHHPWPDMFMAAVGLAVAAIPEGLPAIMTITLAIGVQRMARRNAIIRRLPAVETLGSVTVICSDKTGTLTKNEMTVRSVVTGCGVFQVSGTGYDPHGMFHLEGEPVEIADYPTLVELTRAALLCNDAVLHREGEVWQLVGDPTEGALVALAMKAGHDARLENERWRRVDVVPFESEHQLMATLHHDHAGHAFVYVKGAPERVLDLCPWQRMRGEDSVLDRFYWQAEMDAMAAEGQRLLAVAFKPVEAYRSDLTLADMDMGLTLLGVVGMIDPPREEAIVAVRQCHAAGVRVKMITGDHAATARAVGASMGIGEGREPVTGAVVEKMDDAALRQAVRATDIFARTSPEHKLRLVSALQANGEVVAMTGDGVNDAPALKRADIGIAMGQKGTEVSKEAAEVVLADDNFATIAHAVAEGRTVYDNLKKAILFVLPTNGGEAGSIIAAVVFGRMLPITPVQILWVNMITAVTLALTLAAEHSEKNIMTRAPRDPKEPLLTGFLLWRLLFVSLILVAGTFGLFLWYREHGASLEEARTVAVNTLVMFEIFYLFSVRYFHRPAFTVDGLLGNPYVLYAVGLLVVFQLAFTYVPPMQALFHTTALSAGDWLNILAVSSSVFVLVELEKMILRNGRDG